MLVVAPDSNARAPPPGCPARGGRYGTGEGVMQALAYGLDDLAHTRFATSALGHLFHGVHNSPCSRRSPLRERWWRSARRQVPAHAVPLIELINADPTRIPAFLLPMPSAGSGGTVEPSLDDELEYLRSGSPERIAAALATQDAADPPTGPDRPEPRLVRELRDGTPRAVRGLAEVTRALFTACMAADWPDIRMRLRLDLSERAQVMMARGPAGVLATLHPTVAWKDGRLLLSDACGRFPESARGCGLTLMPCAFGRDSVHPMATQDGTRRSCTRRGRHRTSCLRTAGTPSRP
jgi:hypothetical protein